MENKIKLSENQSRIITNILSLKAQLQKELQALMERENEFVVTLCDAKDIEVTEGIQLIDGYMVIPVKPKEITKEE